MKITVENIEKEYPKIGVSLPTELKNNYEFVRQNLDLYNESKAIKKTIDDYVLTLNQELSKKNSSKGSSKKAVQQSNTGVDKNKQSKRKTPVKTTKSTPKKSNQDVKVDQVEHFSLEEKFLKRYMLLHGKTKTRGQLLNFLKTLQKAIVDKQIRKTSQYAKEIEHIQGELIKTYNLDLEEIEVSLNEKKLTELKKLFAGKKQRLSVTYIKRFIGFFGQMTKEKAERLLNLIVKALETGKITKSDPYYKRIKTTEKSLKEYLDKEEISISTSELRGLAGCVGLAVPRVGLSTIKRFKDSDLVPSTELRNYKFPKLGITGKWRKAFGDVGRIFHLMIFGQGGKGKSTMTIDFAHYLCDTIGLRVLYIADEEKQGDTMGRKLEHLNAYHDNLIIVGELPSSLKGFDVVVFDSITTMGMSPDELKEIQKKNEGLSTIYINQTNKKGEFFGLKKWEHLCDIMVKYESGVLEVKKNRFGETGIHKINYYKNKTTT